MSKKRELMVTAITCLALFLTACGGGGSGGGGNGNNNNNPPQTSSNNWDSLVWDEGEWQ